MVKYYLCLSRRRRVIHGGPDRIDSNRFSNAPHLLHPEIPCLDTRRLCESFAAQDGRAELLAHPFDPRRDIDLLADQREVKPLRVSDIAILCAPEVQADAMRECLAPAAAALAVELLEVPVRVQGGSHRCGAGLISIAELRDWEDG